MGSLGKRKISYLGVKRVMFSFGYVIDYFCGFLVSYFFF